MTYEVGQKVLLIANYSGVVDVHLRPPQEVEVVKVGTKLVYVDIHGRPTAYRIEGGYRNDEYSHTRIATREAYAAEQRRRNVLNALEDRWGVGLTGGRGRHLTNDQLEEILGALEGPRGPWYVFTEGSL